MKKLVFEILGWYGVIAVLTSYALVSTKVWAPDSIIYQAVNLSGAIPIVIICIIKKTWQPFALNAIWGAIAIIAIVLKLMI